VSEYIYTLNPISVLLGEKLSASYES